MRSVVIGNVVERRIRLEQGSALLETHRDDSAIDFGRLIYWNTGEHSAIPLQCPGAVMPVLKDIGKLDTSGVFLWSEVFSAS